MAFHSCQVSDVDLCSTIIRLGLLTTDLNNKYEVLRCTTMSQRFARVKLRIAWGGILTLLLSCFTVQFSQSVSQASQTMTNYGSIVPRAHIVYHESTFSYTQPPEFDYYDRFPSSEPLKYRPEKGQWGWVSTRSYGGNMYLIPDPTDNSRGALKMVYDVAGYTGGNKHVKLYELQGRPLAQNGAKENYNVEPYISKKTAYYHFKVWFPSNTTIASWRLVWQLCGEDGVYGVKTFPPQVRLNFEGSNLKVIVDDYYYSDGRVHRWPITSLADIPKDQWVQFVVFYKQGSGFRVEDGTMIVWMNGVNLFERHDLPTAMPSGTPFVIWGIGLYGSPNEPVGQVQLFKDIKVTSEHTGS